MKKECSDRQNGNTKMIQIMIAVLLSTLLVVGAGFLISGVIAFFSAPKLVPERVVSVQKISVFLIFAGIAIFILGLVPIILLARSVIRDNKV